MINDDQWTFIINEYLRSLIINYISLLQSQSLLHIITLSLLLVGLDLNTANMLPQSRLLAAGDPLNPVERLVVLTRFNQGNWAVHGWWSHHLHHWWSLLRGLFLCHSCVTAKKLRPIPHLEEIVIYYIILWYIVDRHTHIIPYYHTLWFHMIPYYHTLSHMFIPYFLHPSWSHWFGKCIRARMVANVGAVGALSCRVSGAEIQATQQSYALSGCQLDPGERRNMERSWGCHGKIMGISEFFMG